MYSLPVWTRLDDEYEDLFHPDENGVWVSERIRESCCRCGKCCRYLIVKADLDDAAGEPKIKELAAPIYEDVNDGVGSQRKLIGYLLNNRPDGDRGCVFLDDDSNLCTIHDTKPKVCRTFDCDIDVGQQEIFQRIERARRLQQDTGE